MCFGFWCEWVWHLCLNSYSWILCFGPYLTQNCVVHHSFRARLNFSARLNVAITVQHQTIILCMTEKRAREPLYLFIYSLGCKEVESARVRRSSHLTLSTPIFLNPTCRSLKLWMYSCSSLAPNLTFFRGIELGNSMSMNWQYAAPGQQNGTDLREWTHQSAGDSCFSRAGRRERNMSKIFFFLLSVQTAFTETNPAAEENNCSWSIHSKVWLIFLYLNDQYKILNIWDGGRSDWVETLLYTLLFVSSPVSQLIPTG